MRGHGMQCAARSSASVYRQIRQHRRLGQHQQHLRGVRWRRGVYPITPSLLPHYIIMPPLDHAPSGSGLTSAAEPDGGAEPPSAPLSDADDAAVAGASRCAVDPGTSSSWIFRHSAPPSERTEQPGTSVHHRCARVTHDLRHHIRGERSGWWMDGRGDGFGLG